MKRRILFLENSGMRFDGSRYYCENNTGIFLRELVNCGNTVTSYGQFMVGKDLLHKFPLEENGIQVVGILRRRKKWIHYLFLYLKIIPFVVKADFVYLYYPTSLRIVVLLCKLFNVKYGIYIRGMQGIESWFSKWIYKNSSIVLTVSDQFSQMVNGVVGKIVAQTIRPMLPYSDIDIEWNRQYNGDLKEILFLARVAKEKGVDELFSALKILSKSGYNLHCTFVGEGAYLENAQQKVIQLGISDIVSIKGAVYDREEKRKYFLQSDLYILPTYHEGFPRTLYESMIFGTPIITTFVGGIPALMKDEYNCKRIEPMSIDSIVNALKFAIDNYSSMIEYAKNGMKTVEKVVDSKRLTHAQLLDSIIG